MNRSAFLRMVGGAGLAVAAGASLPEAPPADAAPEVVAAAGERLRPPPDHALLVLEYLTGAERTETVCLHDGACDVGTLREIRLLYPPDPDYRGARYVDDLTRALDGNRALPAWLDPEYLQFDLHHRSGRVERVWVGQEIRKGTIYT